MQIPTNWTFNSAEVADHFDDHVIEQLPWYPMATDLMCHLARCYLQDKSILVDLGCSTGGITKKLAKVIHDRQIQAYSIDSAQEMVDKFQGVGEVSCGDMTNVNLYPDFDVCIICLALMFTDVSGRDHFLNSLKAKLKPGGAIIILDKIEPPAGYLGTCISRMSIKNKFDSGVNAQSIIEKELSLCGSQRPTTDHLFQKYAYKPFFRVGDFIGYIYESKLL
ncbi:class I SAM-dependent methyltransferase [Endozoicomonas euniceicola]|uniref:Class I SAM-dependent methyltransferase n=1 Tax=Endozoicomonas euniceicola TaxID=1234143 RepID=A0ABY6GTV4_9GAMM|nr:class I SAM-dependent methyltransferase [Endozoicomonas euniceicola]UYM16206.1 class I SAM-dependent methyltransferase [Endozoicomonas euniceicola]